MSTSRRRRLMLVVLTGGSLLGGVGVAGCGSSDGGDTAAGTSAPPQPATPTATVGMEGVSFKPDAVTVQAGGAVTWKNTSTISHNVTGEGYASKTLAIGDEYRHTYDKPGSYDYLCTFHAGMKGTVSVP